MLVQGLWSKSAAGVWTFEEDSGFRGDTIMITGTDSFEGLVEMIRIRLCLGILTPVALTYQLPEWMRLPEASRTPPINLTCDKDVEILASVREYMTEPVVYVTSGPEPVAKYQFLCRYPFTIGEKTYLEEGVTEEQHRQAIRGLWILLVFFKPLYLIFVSKVLTSDYCFKRARFGWSPSDSV